LSGSTGVTRPGANAPACDPPGNARRKASLADQTLLLRRNILDSSLRLGPGSG